MYTRSEGDRTESGRPCRRAIQPGEKGVKEEADNDDVKDIYPRDRGKRVQVNHPVRARFLPSYPLGTPSCGISAAAVEVFNEHAA